MKRIFVNLFGKGGHEHLGSVEMDSVSKGDNINLKGGTWTVDSVRNLSKKSSSVNVRPKR